MVTVYIGIGAVALIIISQAGGLATTRRRGRFDTVRYEVCRIACM